MSDAAVVGAPAVHRHSAAGLAVITLRPARESGVGTPWKQSQYAVAALAIGLALGMV